MADMDFGAAVDSYMAGPTPAQNLKNTLIDAVGKNPDQAADWRKAAADIGVPVDTAAALPDWSRNQQRLKQINADELANLNPVTATFLTQSSNAAIAHDDTANMGMIETLANSFRRGVPALQQGLASTALASNARTLEQFDEIARRIDAGEKPERILAADDPMGVAWMTPAQRAQFRERIATPLAGNIATVSRAQAAREAIPQPAVVNDVMQAKTFGDAFSAFMQAPVQFVASIGPESLVSNAPGMVAAIPAGIAGGPAAAAAVMGAGSFTTDYGASIIDALTNAGVDVGNPQALTEAVGNIQLMRSVYAQAFAHASVVGSVDAASGGVASKIALPKAVATRLATKPVARELASLAVQTPVQGALGGIGEAGGELAAGQDLSPGNILAEVVGEAFSAPGEVASIAGKQVIERVTEARAAEVHAERVEQLSKLVEASKLRERDPETFKAFVDQIAEGANGNPSELYIDAQTLVATLNQAGIGMTALQEAAPSVAAQLSQGEFMPGTDIRLPVSELLVAPAELTQPLIDHLRASPESMSRAEAGEYLKTQGEDLRATVEQELAKAGNREAYQAEVQKVYDYFQAELDTAGKFRPEVNKAYATLLGNFYATQAARAGIPLAEFMDRYQLRVRAKTPQQGAQTLEQITPEQARATNVPVDLPTAPEFAEAVGNTEGAQVTPEGLAIDLVRFQKPEQIGDQSVRTGVFYLPKGSKNAKHYKGSDTFYGGTEKIEAPTLLRRPLFVKGATGGKAPEAAYDAIHGKGAFKKLDAEILSIVNERGWMTRQEGEDFYVQHLENFLEKHGADRGMAWPIVNNSRKGNQLRYAIQENIIAHAVRDAGYDAVVGYSKGKAGAAISEVFDVREQTYPVEGMDSEVHEKFSTLAQSTLPDRLIQTEVQDKDGTPYDVTITRTFTGANRDTPQVLVEARTKDGNRRGLVDFSVDADGTLRAELAKVAGPYQRKGLATAMYKAAQEAGYKIAPGRAQTESGAGMVQALQAQGVIGEGAITPDSTYNQGARGTLSFAQDITTAPSVVALLENADLSTFLHESGHFFLEVQADLAARIAAKGDEATPAEKLILEDFGKLLNWFGVQGTDTSPDAKTIRSTINQYMKENPQAAEALRALNRARITAANAGWTDEHSAAVIAAEEKLLEAPGGEKLADLEDQRKDIDERDQGQGRGPTALATWLSMTADEKRDHHEQFARSFERYLMEGNAPSQALNSLFARFRAWLVSIYQTLSSLNSNLDDDVRGVMGRMLAGDLAIAEQQAARGMGLLFTSPEQAGMTLDEFNAYHALAAQATANAEATLDARLLKDMKWMSGARNKAIKAAQADAAAKRNAVEAQVRGEVMAEPVYKAWNFLTGKNQGEQVVPGVTQVEGIDVEQENGKLRTSLVKELDPAAAEILMARRMTSDKTGMHPDIAAELFGYASGNEMVQELAMAQDPEVVIEGKTDQRMLEEYGDISSPAALNRAADEAVHNEVRARVIAAELAALQRANRVRGENPNEAYASRRNTVDVMAKAAREYAERVVARLQLKNLRPKQYTAAEARSAKLAEQNLGNTAEAAMHKRNQLVNNYAALAAFDAQDEVRKANEFFKRVMKGTPEDIAKTRDVGIVQAARAVLSLYGIGSLPKGESAQNYIDTLAKNNPDMSAIITERIGALVAGAKPVGELTVEQFQGLHEEIQSLWFLAKRTRQVEVDGKLVDRMGVQQDLVDRMNEIGVPARVPGEGQAVTDAERRRTKLQTLGAALRRVETWVGIKDGKDIGAFRKYVWQPVKEAADRYRADKAVYIKRYKELLDTLDLGKQRIDAPELNYTFGHSRGGSGKAEILHAILHTGNESNKRKLLLGRKWATENADGTLDTTNWDAFVNRMIDKGVLTKADFDFAQGVWDLLEETKPKAQAAHRATFGYYFNEVSADAFTNQFGTYRGGYVPAMTDPEVVKDAATRALQEDENQTLAYAFPATNKGFTKSRVEYNRPLLLDLRVIGSHIDKVLLFSHMEQPVRDVRRVLSSPQVSTMLHRIDPTAYDSLLTPWLNRAARQTVEQRVPGDANLMRFFSIARQHAGMAAMFANVSNAVQQITGFSLAAVKVRPKYLMPALASYLIAPRQVARTVAESSIYMNNRMSSEVGKMEDAINEILLNPNVYQKAQNWTKQHTYFLQSAVDNVMGPIIWTGAYNQALEAGHSEKDAVRLADAAIRETQGSTLPEDVSRIETGNAFVRMFTQFAGYFNMQANLLQGEFAKTMHSMGLRQGIGRGLYIFTFGFLVPNVIAEAISQAFKGGPDDDDKDGDTIDDWLWSTLFMGNVKAALAMVPIVGQVSNAAIAATNSKPYDDRISTSPAVSMIESAVVGNTKNAYAAATGGTVDGRKVVRDLATLISLTTGLPATAVARPVGYMVGVSENRIAPTSAADAARGVITGTPSPESKR